jgi:hypothetical protein
MFPSTKRGAWASAGCSIVLCCTTLSIAQGAKPAQISEVPAVELVRDTVAQEVAAANQNDSKHMFLSHKKTAKGSQTRLYVETNDAMAGMLVAINDKPLDAQQHQAEVDHLAWLMGSPEQLKKKHAREKEDAERTLRIVKAMPDAFRYQYDGTEVGSAVLGKSGAELSRLKFTPNPEYSPPSRVEQVLQGMEGYLLIDRSARRIARIDGTLFREVTFGWGIIGHLDKGGHFRVQQADVGDGSWNITQMSLRMTGKILLFKSLSMISDETFSQFHKVPEDLPFGKGVELLKAEQEKIAQSGSIQSAAISKESQ